MPKYAAYDATTGRIDHVRETDEARLQFHSLPPGHRFVESSDFEVLPETHYVLDGEVTLSSALDNVERSYSIAADAIASVAFTLPSGTVVTFEGAEYVGEEDFSFTTDIPGEYRFLLTPPPAYRVMEVVINAV